MSIPFTCPHCGASMKVAEQYAGQSGPCAKCGKPITVPPLAGAFAPAAKSSGGTLAIILIVGAVGLGLLVVCGGILTALLLPAVQSARGAAQRMECSNNLKRLAIAIHNYHDTYRALPSAYVANEEGKPMHSWRVSLLPFVEASPTFNRYDFRESWDSPVNQALVNQRPKVYGCPTTLPDPMSTKTSYFMLTGPGTIYDGPNQWPDFSRISDGTSNTIMFVEVPGLNVDWMEPRDVTLDELIQLVNASPQGSHSPAGIGVVMCDGATRFLNLPLDANALKAMASPDGGEQVPLP